VPFSPMLAFASLHATDQLEFQLLLQLAAVALDQALLQLPSGLVTLVKAAASAEAEELVLVAAALKAAASAAAVPVAASTALLAAAPATEPVVVLLLLAACAEASDSMRGCSGSEERRARPLRILVAAWVGAGFRTAALALEVPGPTIGAEFGLGARSAAAEAGSAGRGMMRTLGERRGLDCVGWRLVFGVQGGVSHAT